MQPRQWTRRGAGLLSALLVFCTFASPVLAQSSQATVTIDGRTLTFDQPPVVQAGRILVPLRGIFEGLGATVVYDAPSRSIRATRGSTSILLPMGSRIARVNGQDVSLDVPASSVGGRTLVPLRFISEALGAAVEWNASTRTVAITSPGGTAGGNPPSVSYPGASPSPSTTASPAAGRPSIDNVVVSQRVVRPGETLGVVMTGTPGGMASFDLMGARTGIRMAEVAPGRYEGYLPVTPGMSLQRGTVLAHLVVNGVETIRQAERGVSINPGAVGYPQGPSGPGYPGGYPAYPPAQGPLFVSVSGPQAGQSVGSDFPVTGRATPYATIQLELTSQQALIPGLIGIQGRTITAQGQADAAGNFSIPVHLGSLPRNTRITMRTRALDAQGNSSQWVQQDIAVGP